VTLVSPHLVCALTSGIRFSKRTDIARENKAVSARNSTPLTWLGARIRTWVWRNQNPISSSDLSCAFRKSRKYRRCCTNRLPSISECQIEFRGSQVAVIGVRIGGPLYCKTHYGWRPVSLLEACRLIARAVFGSYPSPSVAPPGPAHRRPPGRPAAQGPTRLTNAYVRQVGGDGSKPAGVSKQRLPSPSDAPDIIVPRLSR
jgi:hypothetical protein